MSQCFVQVGASRDGLDPYLDPARRRGMHCVLVETADYLQWRRVLGRRDFDEYVPVEVPSHSRSVSTAIVARDLEPTIILTGFERYTASAYAVARACRVPPWRAGAEFKPPDKARQRSAVAATASIAQPRHCLVSRLADVPAAANEVSYPLVLKPTDGGAGLGVVSVDDSNGLNGALEFLARLTNYDGGKFSGWIVEERLDGDEFSVQGIAYERANVVLSVCDKIIAHEVQQRAPLVQGFREVGHIARPGMDACADVRRFVDLCLDAVDYRSGPFHIDFIRKDGRNYLLEMGFRLSGTGLVDLVMRVSGIDWAEEVFRANLGEAARPAAAHRYAGQVVILREAEFCAAYALAAQLPLVAVQRYAQPKLPADWGSEIPLALRSDILRFAGVRGRAVIDGPSVEEIRRNLECIRAAYLPDVTPGVGT